MAVSSELEPATSRSRTAVAVGSACAASGRLGSARPRVQSATCRQVTADAAWVATCVATFDARECPRWVLANQKQPDPSSHHRGSYFPLPLPRLLIRSATNWGLCCGCFGARWKFKLPPVSSLMRLPTRFKLGCGGFDSLDGTAGWLVGFLGVLVCLAGCGSASLLKSPSSSQRLAVFRIFLNEGSYQLWFRRWRLWTFLQRRRGRGSPVWLFCRARHDQKSLYSAN